MKKLALGTVQFGLNYGIANSGGQVSKTEIKKILTLAKEQNIGVIDTAIGYGNSESQLGDADVSEFKIITKLPAIPSPNIDINQWVDYQIKDSLQRLRVKKLYGVLFHVPSQLLLENGLKLYKALDNLREEGVIGKIGVSVYSPDELSSLFNEFDFDIVQAPFNILDRRLLQSGWLDKLASLGKEIHTRSVFLQGLLLMNPLNRDPYFTRWKDLFAEFDLWVNENSQSPIQACLDYVNGFEQISQMIIGVDSCSNLKEILGSLSNSSKVNAPDTLICTDLDLINPSNWVRKHNN
jgi:aryl-alcohol dehydrogenase-like predicted oxidoreductase